MKSQEQSNRDKNVDTLLYGLSKTVVRERRPIGTAGAVLLSFVFFAVLGICFIFADCFTAAQVTILGVAGATAMSFFVLVVTLHNEKRYDYRSARKSAVVLSEILDSVHQQIEQTKNGHRSPIYCPSNWLDYYQQCCIYLKYDYLPYLLREIGIIEKLNHYIGIEDEDGIADTIAYRKRGITDWTFDFDILSTRANLSGFASGYAEMKPWRQQAPYLSFEKFMIENYHQEIKCLTIDYLKEHDGQCDADSAEYYVMEQLRLKKDLQTGKYKFTAMDNRAMLSVIFKIYLGLEKEDEFTLCWGKLSLKDEK